MESTHDPAVRIEGLQELIKLISQSEEPINLKRRDAAADQALKERETERRGKQDYFELRKNWSLYLCTFLAVMIGFQMVLIILVGLNRFSFNDDKPFLYLVVGENFFQIVGMCIIVVRFLFPKEIRRGSSPL